MLRKMVFILLQKYLPNQKLHHSTKIKTKIFHKTMKNLSKIKPEKEVEQLDDL